MIALAICMRRLVRAFWAPWAALALVLSCASGCDFSGRTRAADRSAAAKSERSFDHLFRENCAGCHGAHGKLGPAPPLADELFLALIADDELRRVISAGRPGTLMPAFASDRGGRLTAKEVTLLVEGIKLRWGGPIKPGAMGLPPYRLEAGTIDRPGSSETARKAFSRACASCHGGAGQGGTYAGEPGGIPVGAINVPEFLALLSDQALRRLIITGRADLGMPSSSDGHGRPAGYKPLSSGEVTELVALLASWRQGEKPSGKEN